MFKTQKGFTIVETLAVILIVSLISLAGYYIWHTQHKKESKTVTMVSSCVSATPGTGDIKVEDTPSLPSGYSYQGPLECDTELSITIALNSKNPSGLTNEVNSVTDPSSPNYRHYLTQQQTEKQFGPPSSEINGVIKWLKGYGISSSFDGYINTTTTVSNLDKAFKTVIDKVRRSDGKGAYANVKPLYAPKSLAGGIQAIIGADNLVQINPQNNSNSVQ